MKRAKAVAPQSLCPIFGTTTEDASSRFPATTGNTELKDFDGVEANPYNILEIETMILKSTVLTGSQVSI